MQNQQIFENAGWIFSERRWRIDPEINDGMPYLAYFERYFTSTKDELQNNVNNANQLTTNNYPNPFNPQTTIKFNLPVSSNVNLSIYNIKGQKVKTLLNKNKKAGEHQVVWKGDNNKGTKVASGIYFYKLKTPKQSVFKKMLMLK